jgi:hypothetical protein
MKMKQWSFCQIQSFCCQMEIKNAVYPLQFERGPCFICFYWSVLNSQILTESLFYYNWYVCKVFMRSSKWFLRKLVFWLSWKNAKIDIIHYNNQAASLYTNNNILKKVNPTDQADIRDYSASFYSRLLKKTVAFKH